MSEEIESKLYCGQEAPKRYPEQEADIRLVLKVKQNSEGKLHGYVYNFEVNNYEGLIPNSTRLVRDYDFQHASDKMIDAAIEHIKEHRA
jgi:hypothetical protein